MVVRSAPARGPILHAHEVPQVLHCIEGRGVLATETERNEVGPGDIVHVPADEMHWHGAAPDSDFTHVSIRPPRRDHLDEDRPAGVDAPARRPT